MKRGDCEFLFSGNTMACKWMDNRSVLLLPWKEWMTYYQVRGEKRVQRTSLWFLVLRLSRFTIAAWVELILWTSILPHIFCMESHLLDFTSAFSLILIDISFVNSYLIYNMKHPSKLFLLDYKIVIAKNLIQYHQGRKRAVPMSRPSKRKNQLNRLIIIEDIYQITKRWENNARTVQWRVKKTELSSSVWLVTFYYA